MPDAFHYHQIADMPQYRVKTDLLPVLRKGEWFDVKTAQETVVSYLSSLLVPTADELLFLELFRSGNYRPELVFGQRPELERIARHAMAEWKCRKNQERTRPQELSL